MSTVNRSTGPGFPLQTQGISPMFSKLPKPLEAYHPLRVYTEGEIAAFMQYSPELWALDAQNYTDKQYVRQMATIYLAIVQNTFENLKNINKFQIENLEKAMLKLQRENSSAYKFLCQVYGIDPTKHKSKKAHCTTTAYHPELIPLCGWGYIELFSTNVQATITRLAKKMYSSTEMDNTTKAKYAHLFFLIIYTYDLMPYDIFRYLEMLIKNQEEIHEQPVTGAHKVSLMYEAAKDMHNQEKNGLFAAVMMQNAYNLVFSRFDDQSISIDMIKIFLDEMIDNASSLRIKECFGLLDSVEKADFKALELEPLKFNEDIRLLKEQLFPYGGYHTDVKLFRTNNTQKFNASLTYAWNKFEKHGYRLGKGVEGYKKPLTFTQIISGKRYENAGYLYCTSPQRIRFSDSNEAWFARYYLSNLYHL